MEGEEKEAGIMVLMEGKKVWEGEMGERGRMGEEHGGDSRGEG